MKHLQLPLTIEERTSLRAGEMILLSGVIYTARDAAHKRLNELLDQGKELPLPLQDQIIYYVGPTPTPPGHIYGSAGPTTSMRMDAYAPRLYDLGVGITIGKGYRTAAVREACVRDHALYLVAIGGAGALLSRCIKKAEIIAYEDLGAEALRRLEVEDLPAFVIIDSEGNNLYETGRKEYLESIR